MSGTDVRWALPMLLKKIVIGADLALLLIPF